MKIGDYLRETWLFSVCVALVIFITDLVLLFSATIGKGTEDVIYLNVLLIFFAVSFWIYGYIRFRSKYRKVYKALEMGESIDYVLPQDNSFFSNLLNDAVQVKNKEYSEKAALYQNNMDELNDYITKWVHEIKIPLSVCELITENGDFDKTNVRQSLRVELERTRFLVNQVLYASRTVHYNEDLSIGEFNLEKAVKEAVKRNAQFFMQKNIEITLDSLGFGVVNDEKWVSYILDQILNNAGKYTGQNGRVDVCAHADDKAIKLYIRDNGIGIVPQDMKRVFDKGFTGENGRKTTKSTGMGMYFSKKIADKLGIGLEVYSNVGENTEFVIVFYKLRDFFDVTKM